MNQITTVDKINDKKTNGIVSYKSGKFDEFNFVIMNGENKYFVNWEPEYHLDSYIIKEGIKYYK